MAAGLQSFSLRNGAVAPKLRQRHNNHQSQYQGVGWNRSPSRERNLNQSARWKRLPHGCHARKAGSGRLLYSRKEVLPPEAIAR